MKRPVFSQLDRLADYGADEWTWTAEKRRVRRNVRDRVPIDELLREDGRVGGTEQGDVDADA